MHHQPRLSPKKWEKMKWVIVKMTGQRDLLRLTLSLWLLLHFLPPSSGFQSCPSVCTCKWKNGESRKEMGKVVIRRNENSFDYVVVKFLMYFYASCSLWDVFWKVWKVRPSNLKNSLISSWEESKRRVRTATAAFWKTLRNILTDVIIHTADTTSDIHKYYTSRMTSVRKN